MDARWSSKIKRQLNLSLINGAAGGNRPRTGSKKMPTEEKETFFFLLQSCRAKGIDRWTGYDQEKLCNNDCHRISSPFEGELWMASHLSIGCIVDTIDRRGVKSIQLTLFHLASAILFCSGFRPSTHPAAAHLLVHLFFKFIFGIIAIRERGQSAGADAFRKIWGQLQQFQSNIYFYF